jgi:hypothetical protein
VAGRRGSKKLLEELGCEIWIGHATAIRLFARRRQKNDRRDADLILDLLMRGDFPRIHRYPAESRAVLQQLRYRQPLVKLRTMLLNRCDFAIQHFSVPVLTLDLLRQLTQLSLLARSRAWLLFRTLRLFRTEIDLALPIYKLQPADSAKFPRVVSDKRQIMLKSNRSYLQIVRSDQCTISFQLSANPGTSMRGGIVEWQRDEGFQK